MPNRLILNSLNRITLVTKGRFTAKHPELREGVVEVVKADEDSWYADFWHFLNSVADDDIPEDWTDTFSEYYIEKAAKKGKNYPDSDGPFAGPHNSFPIRSQSDVYDAARLVGHAANPAAVKSKIISIARSKGYSLPKSWTKKVSKADDLLDAIKRLITGEDIPVEKAKSSMHSHVHSHISTYGYSTYEHNHDHGHQDGVTADSKDHDTHETAHAHAHVSKAGEDVTDEEAKNLQADNEGLKHDLDEAKTKLEAEEAARVAAEAAKDEAEAARVAAEAKVEEVEKALETLKAEKAEAVKKAAEAEKVAEEAARQPKTAAPSPVTKAQADVSTMNFDDALKTLLHS